MDYLYGLDFASSISKNFSLLNIVPFVIIIFLCNSKWCLKYTADKHIDIKITAICIVLILVAIFNSIVFKLSINFISVFCKNKDDLILLISVCIMFIFNFILILCHAKINNIVKKRGRGIDFKYSAMPIFAIMIYWLIPVIFISFNWDLKYLYYGTGSKIWEFLFVIIVIVIPSFKSFFSAENYKMLIYMNSLKMPIRLHANTELIINDSMYTIVYYNKDKSKVIRKDSIPEREVYRIIEHCDM